MLAACQLWQELPFLSFRPPHIDELRAQRQVRDVRRACSSARPRNLLHRNRNLPERATASSVFLVESHPQQTQFTQPLEVIERELPALVIPRSAWRNLPVREVPHRILQQQFIFAQNVSRHVITSVSTKSLPPRWGKVRMGVNYQQHPVYPVPLLASIAVRDASIAFSKDNPLFAAPPPLYPPNTAYPAFSQKQSTPSNPASASHAS